MELTDEIKAQIKEASAKAHEIGDRLTAQNMDGPAMFKLYEEALTLEGKLWSLADDLDP